MARKKKTGRKKTSRKKKQRRWGRRLLYMLLGAAGLNRVARFAMDPRDQRSDADWFEIVAGEDGVFACIGLMACEDICPKDLPLLEVNAYLRRRVLSAGLNLGKREK
jgi:succinate dehydrogenase/fumarate reductase-like Fe-S protein